MQISSVITSRLTLINGVFTDKDGKIVPPEFGNKHQIMILNRVENYLNQIEKNGGINLNCISTESRNKFKVKRELRQFNIYRFYCFCNSEIIITENIIELELKYVSYQNINGGKTAWKNKFTCQCCDKQYKINQLNKTTLCLKPKI